MDIFISVIVPSIEGRQRSLDKCLEAYTKTLSGVRYEILPEFDHTACGKAWIAGAKRARGRYLHFTADDLVPHRGWWQEAIACIDKGRLPAANVLNPTETLECPVYLEPRLPDVPNVLVPLLSREQFDMGDWLIPIHYGTDDWITYLARMRGIEVEFVPEFLFSHSAASEGRLYANREIDVPALCGYMQRYGFVPPVYGQVAETMGWTGWTSP